MNISKDKDIAGTRLDSSMNLKLNLGNRSTKKKVSIGHIYTKAKNSPKKSLGKILRKITNGNKETCASSRINTSSPKLNLSNLSSIQNLSYRLNTSYSVKKPGRLSRKSTFSCFKNKSNRSLKSLVDSKNFDVERIFHFFFNLVDNKKKEVFKVK